MIGLDVEASFVLLVILSSERPGGWSCIVTAFSSSSSLWIGAVGLERNVSVYTRDSSVPTWIIVSIHIIFSLFFSI